MRRGLLQCGQLDIEFAQLFQGRRFKHFRENSYLIPIRERLFSNGLKRVLDFFIEFFRSFQDHFTQTLGLSSNDCIVLTLQSFQGLPVLSIGFGNRFRRDRSRRRLFAAIEHAVERVVVRRRDRVEFVIVTPGAGDCEPHDSPAGHIDSVVVDKRRVVQKASADIQETEGGERAFILSEVESIRRQLLNDELIVGQVFVESANDIVPVGIAVMIDSVFLKNIAFRVCIACDIQPMPPPSLPIERRGEQPVNRFFPGLRGLVAEEGFDFGGRGGQPDQVERGASEECSSICGRSGK